MDKLTSYNLQVLDTLNWNKNIQRRGPCCYKGLLGCARCPHKFVVVGGRRQVKEQPLDTREQQMVCRLWPAADSTSGTGKKAGGCGGRPNVVDLAAAVERITGAVEPFEADNRGGWPSAATVEEITGPWSRLRQTNAEVGQARLRRRIHWSRRHGAIGEDQLRNLIFWQRSALAEGSLAN